jgi:hypothetical protein
MKYKYREGYHQPKGMAADKVARELEIIRARRGMLTAPILLDEARKKSHPLHNCFEWNDSKAAEQFRLQQARSLIKSIEVHYEEEGEALERRVYHFTMREDVKQYAPAEIIMMDKNSLEYTIRRIEKHLDTLAQELAVFSKMTQGTTHEKSLRIMQRSLSRMKATAESCLAKKAG